MFFIITKKRLFTAVAVCAALVMGVVGLTLSQPPPAAQTTAAGMGDHVHQFFSAAVVGQAAVCQFGSCAHRDTSFL